MRSVRAAVAAFVLLSVVATSQAASAAAVPPTPVFTAAIDPYAAYEQEHTCSPTAKPGLVAFQALLDRTYGRQGIDYIVRACGSLTSGHEEGRALDFGLDDRIPSELADAKALLGWLLAPDAYGNKHAMARRLGIMYMSFGGRMWRSYDPPAGDALEQWPFYPSGCALAGHDPTACHDDHIHFSFSWDGAYERTSFFAGRIPCAAPTAAVPAPPVLPSAATRSVPLTPALLMYTVTGLGMPGGACTLSSANRYDLAVLGRGGVPTSGVSAVDLYVTALRPSASVAWLLTASSGGLTIRQGGVLATMTTPGSSVVTLPIGTDGKVSLRVSAGLVDASVWVLGYRTAALTGSTLHRRVAATGVVSAWVPPGTTTVATAGVGGLPVSGVKALDVVVTVRGGARSASVGVGASTSSPTPSVLIGAGELRTVSLLTKVDATGHFVLVNRTADATAVTVSVTGWYGDAAGGEHFVATPVRLVDTGAGPLAAGALLSVAVAGVGGVPADARGIVLDLSTAGTSPGHLWAWGSSALPAPVRMMEPGGWGGLVVVPIAVDGRISLRAEAAATLNLRAVGYYR